MKKAFNKYRGFTLIELMITLAIAAILLTVGIPSFNEVIKNSRLSTQVNSLVTALSLGRSEAVKRGQSVTICKSANGTSCVVEVGSWSSSDDGWIVFVDTNSDGVVDAGELLLRVFSKLKSGNTLKYSRIRVTYNGQGNTPGLNGTFVVCDDRGSPEAKGGIVSNTGRVRRAIDSNSDGTVEDGSGNNITCP
jgi:type IV fimbrial biogenesis protein FimT